MRLALLCLLALGTAGCVSKARYNALKTDYDDLITDNARLAQELQTCKATAQAIQESAQKREEAARDDTPRRGPTGNRSSE